MTQAIHQSYLSTLRRERYKTPHNHRETATNNHQLVLMLLRCSSHLGGGNHQEKQKIHSHNDPQVPLDAITQANALGITLNLTIMMNQ